MAQTPASGIYVLQGIDPAQIAAAPVDFKVVDLYNDDGQLFTNAQVAQMGAGGGVVLGYFSIGEAESYRSYFASLPSSALGPVDPSWPGDYAVAYWTDAWKAVAVKYIDQMITQGYKGAYFDVVDEYDRTWAKAHAPGGDSAKAMVDLVQYLASYARAEVPGFQIWINSSGAENLLANSSLVQTINGAFEEELFDKDSGCPQSTADTSYNLALLNNVVTAGKSVIAIEYITGAAKVADVQSRAALAGIGVYVANPNRALNGVDSEGFSTSTTTPTSPMDLSTPMPPVTPPTSTTKPLVKDVSASATWAYVTRGDIVKVAVTFNESMTVHGTPALTLNDGGKAFYVSGSGTKTLTFSHKVGSNQNTTTLSVTGVSLSNGATIKNSAGVAANLTGVTSSMAGRVVVDTSRHLTKVAAGTGQVIDAGSKNDAVVLSSGNASLVFHGGNNVAFLGGGSGAVNASIQDNGTGLNVYILNGGVDKISGLASDPSAMIHLLGGIGGYTSASQAVSSLKTDEAGGSLLSLGSGKSIDFIGVPPANLHAANFLIG